MPDHPGRLLHQPGDVAEWLRSGLQSRVHRFDSGRRLSGVGNGGEAWSPLVDIEETEDAWIVEAELPGVDRKDVTVELRESELEISGEIPATDSPRRSL